MKNCWVTVAFESGLHARPAANLMKEAQKFQSDIRIGKDGQECNAKSLVDILRLGANCGDMVEIRCSGADEDAALETIKNYIEDTKG